jgi:hypothetical protein
MQVFYLKQMNGDSFQQPPLKHLWRRFFAFLSLRPLRENPFTYNQIANIHPFAADAGVLFKTDER